MGNELSVVNLPPIHVMSAGTSEIVVIPADYAGRALPDEMALFHDTEVNSNWNLDIWWRYAMRVSACYDRSMFRYLTSLTVGHWYGLRSCVIS